MVLGLGLVGAGVPVVLLARLVVSVMVLGLGLRLVGAGVPVAVLGRLGPARAVLVVLVAVRASLGAAAGLLAGGVVLVVLVGRFGARPVGGGLGGAILLGGLLGLDARGPLLLGGGLGLGALVVLLLVVFLVVVGPLLLVVVVFLVVAVVVLLRVFVFEVPEQLRGAVSQIGALG